MLEYLHLEKGDQPKTKDIFEGIDMTWGRVVEYQGAQPLIAELIETFDPLHPAGSLDKLHAVNEVCVNITDPWHARKRSEVEALVRGCSALSGEMGAANWNIAQGTNDSLELRALVRSRTDVGLTMVYPELAPGGSYMGKLQQNVPFQYRFHLFRFGTPSVDQPYWLSRPHTALFDVLEVKNIGLPETIPGLSPRYGVDINPTNGMALYRWVDRVDGERIRPVYVTPVASVIPKTDVLIARGGPQQVVVEVEALTDSLTGKLSVTLPEGWMTTKDLKLVDIAKRNERQSFTFQLIPTENAKGGSVKFTFTGPKGTADRTLHEIDYPHIMPQVYYTPAEVKLVPLNVTTSAKTVGYIKGAGDDVPQAIELLGVTVDMIEPSTATLESISKYDAIVVGIRAYNNNHGMKRFNPVLMKYVENGGTVVVQYTTRTNDMVLPDSLIGPYPFKLTRDRVTVEEATPTFLAK